MTIYTFNASAITGGTTTALDAISKDDIGDGDRAFVTSNNILYYYQYDSSSTDPEASPTFIRPDDFNVSGVWVLQTISDANSTPAGAYLDFAGDAAPSGYLICNGIAVSRTTYSVLFSAIGTRYGIGDGSTTFNIPDWRGLFPRCADDGTTGADPDSGTRTNSGDGTTGANVGTKQSSANLTHIHTVNPPSTSTTADTHNHSITLYGYSDAESGSGKTTIGGAGTFSTDSDTHNHSVNIAQFDSGSSGVTESRPVNMYQLRCIKY